MNDAVDALLRLPDQAGAEPAARRELTVYGAPAELVWLPQRAGRGGVPGRHKAAFLPAVADRILREEALWEDEHVGATPNIYPFGAGQLVLWSKAESREPTVPLLELLSAMADATGGTALINTIGAAASVSRSHGHLLRETLPFLDHFAERPLAAPWLDRRQGVEVVQKALPYLLVGLRGTAEDRARAAGRALELRTTAAVSVIDTGGTTWILPRSAEEIPAPSFPHAIGAAEAWGRWCYLDRADLDAATPERLEDALLRSGLPTEPAARRR